MSKGVVLFMFCLLLLAVGCTSATEPAVEIHPTDDTPPTVTITSQPTLVKEPVSHDVDEPLKDCGVDDLTWEPFESSQMGYSVQIPSSWVVFENKETGNATFRFRDFPREETDPFIYTVMYPRNGQDFPELVRPHLSDELWAAFTYEESSYNDYPAFTTTGMPSMDRALVIFVETPDRYLSFGLTPWQGEDDPPNPFAVTEVEFCLFETMLQTIVVKDVE